MQAEKEKNEDEDSEEEKVITSEDMKTELENLKLRVDKNSKTTDNFLFLNKLAILRKFNESTLISQFGNPSSTRVTLMASSSTQVKVPLPLLENETILASTCKSAYFHRTLETLVEIEGDFQVTDYRITFLPSSDFCSKEFILQQYFCIPAALILSMIKKKESNGKYKYTLKFSFKDRPGMTIGFSDKKEYSCVNERLSVLLAPKSSMNYFAFKYFVKYEHLDNVKENGWIVYQHLLEYIRMGVDLNDVKCIYKLYIQEIDGEICPTYPNYIYVHKSSSIDDISKAAVFRIKGRFPALSWFSKDNHASLWRSSQAKIGVIDKRNSYEEKILSLLSKDTEKIHIYDARTFINAFANKVKGLGFENALNYKNCQLMFCDIDNIHAVRNSFTKLKLISQLPLEGYFDWQLDFHETKWLHLLAKIIKSSVDIAASLLENATVLVHCSDGWDRTSQLSALAEIIIDPFYRTLKGFEVLIEKEWVSFGHQFAARCGHSIPRDEEEVSPIFIQFLDCVYQFVNQFPEMFEFNSYLLYFISYHVYSCLYGTFLMNSEKEQLTAFIKLKTVSIWTDVNMNPDRFMNKEYDSGKSIRTILTPSCAIYKLKLWEEYFLRWNPYYVMNHSDILQMPYI